MIENPWTIVNSKEVYENPWIALTEFDVINPGGGKGIYGKVHFKSIAVGVVALDDERNLYLVGQFRFPTNTYSWEIPEGGSAIGLDPLEGAKRELKEEIGVVAANWKELFRMHLSNSVSDELAIIYLATGLICGESEPEETEILSVKKVTIDEAYRMVTDGLITDSISVASILKIKLLFQEGLLK